MATAVTTFNFASTLQSWSSITALASGETNGLDTVNGNPADALFGKLVGKTKASTAGAGMKLSQSLTAWGVPSGATVTAVSVALDKKCVTAPGSAIGSGSFSTKLNLNAGASTNTGPTQTLSTTADSVWTTLGTGSNAALSGLSDSTLTHLLEVDILYTLSTTSSALTSTTWQIDWDNVVVTVTYTINVPGAPGTPTGTTGSRQTPLSWTDNASNGGAAVTDHHVYVYNAPSAGTLLNTLDTASATTSYTATGLVGATYYFEVTATNSAGESAHSTRSAAVVVSDLAWTVLVVPSTDSGTTFTANGFTVTARSFLLAVYEAPIGETSQVSDDAGNLWSDTGMSINDGTVRVGAWIAPNVLDGTPTITLTGDGTTQSRSMGIWQVTTARSGYSPQFDIGGTATGAFPLAVSTTGPTTTDADAMFTSVLADISLSSNPTPSSGYGDNQNTGPLAHTLFTADGLAGVAGTQTATWTCAGNATTPHALIIAVKQVITPIAFAQFTGMAQAVNRSNTY